MIALVTGASRGIGRAIADIFIAHGATVYGVARHWSEEQAMSPHFIPIAADITDPQSRRTIITDIKSAHGHLDVLVNNAGCVINRPIGMIVADDLEAMLQVNLVAPIMLSQSAVRIMQPGSSILNIASVTAVKGAAGQTAYSATKGALISFTRSAAKELAPRGIRVNAIAPGLIDTPLYRQMLDSNPQAVASRLSRVALGHPGLPNDIANTAYFLSSPEASYITGQVLTIDGLSSP